MSLFSCRLRSCTAKPVEVERIKGKLRREGGAGTAQIYIVLAASHLITPRLTYSPRNLSGGWGDLRVALIPEIPFGAC
jgi:hypothetical protein